MNRLIWRWWFPAAILIWCMCPITASTKFWAEPEMTQRVKKSHKWIILHLDNKLILFEKSRMPGNYENNYGELVLNYLQMCIRDSF